MTRSTFRSLRTALLSSSLTVGIGGIASAQDTTTPPLTSPGTVTPAPATEVPAAATPAEPGPSVPPIVGPSPVAVEPPPPPPPPSEPVGEAEAPSETVAEESRWYDDFSLGVFVDAYGALRSDAPGRRPSAPPGTAIPGQYPHEAFVTGEGFALAFAGLDAAYSGDKFGATISLRFGPAVNRFYFADNGPLGIDNITQAFVTYKPTERLTFDLGQFGTLYGAEVAESWRNVNYSRGGLYYAMQPFWHTGLRANIQLHETFALNAMVVNGVNNAFEGNKSPSIGVQGVLTATEEFSLAVGYLGALHPRDGEEAPFHNFFDVVATVNSGGFRLVTNFDFNSYKLSGGDRENWWGVSVAPAYAFTDYFGLGARVEYLSDSANFLFAMPDPSGEADEEGNVPTLGDATSLVTLTGTLDIKPVPGSSALVIRPEFRYEFASDDYFLDQDGDLTKGFWTAVLGVVVTSMD